MAREATESDGSAPRQQVYEAKPGAACAAALPSSYRRRDTEATVLHEVNLFVRALFTFQRRRARKLGIRTPHTGAVAFVQRFGSALQLTPHFHVLVPEAVFERVPMMGPEPDAMAARPHSLPPPDDEEVERLLRTVALRVVRLFRKHAPRRWLRRGRDA